MNNNDKNIWSWLLEDVALNEAGTEVANDLDNKLFKGLDRTSNDRAQYGGPIHCMLFHDPGSATLAKCKEWANAHNLKFIVMGAADYLTEYKKEYDVSKYKDAVLYIDLDARSNPRDAGGTESWLRSSGGYGDDTGVWFTIYSFEGNIDKQQILHLLITHSRFTLDMRKPQESNEDLKEYYDDPDYWCDKQGPVYLVSYKGKQAFYLQYPYAGDPYHGGRVANDKELLKDAKEVITDWLAPDEEVDEAQISFEDADPYDLDLDLEIYNCDYDYSIKTENLEEHINDRPADIESDQKYQGIDNAVVDCKKYTLVAHSEDEKPVDCKMEKHVLPEPLAGDEVDVKVYEDIKDKNLTLSEAAVKNPEISKILKRCKDYLDKAGLEVTKENQQKAINTCCSEEEKQLLRNAELDDGTIVTFLTEAENLEEAKKTNKFIEVAENLAKKAAKDWDNATPEERAFYKDQGTSILFEKYQDEYNKILYACSFFDEKDLEAAGIDTSEDAEEIDEAAFWYLDDLLWKYTTIDESLQEAKKDEDEIPPDPEVVKLEVHQELNDLVADEIEAINGYEEVKADILDKPIEHKDDIVDTINHIEDEEKEHIDELIDATTEIPFEGGQKAEEPEVEPVVEEEPEEPEDEEPINDDPFDQDFPVNEGKALQEVAAELPFDSEAKVGDSILIVNMEGEPDYCGRKGKIEHIDSLGQLHGTWGGCAVIPGVDKFDIITEESLEEAKRAWKSKYTDADWDWFDKKQQEFETFAKQRVKSKKSVGSNPDEMLDLAVSELGWSVADRNKFEKMLDADLFEESLEEASSAETRAFKNGGQDAQDYIQGKAIARIKDPKARDAAVAAAKAGRPDAVKDFTGDRKEDQAIANFDKKMQTMADAGVQEELNEEADPFNLTFEDYNVYGESLNNAEAANSEYETENGSDYLTLNEDENKDEGKEVDYIEYKHSYCHALKPHLDELNKIEDVGELRNKILDIINGGDVKFTKKERQFAAIVRKKKWANAESLKKYLEASMNKAKDIKVKVDENGELIQPLAEGFEGCLHEVLTEDIDKDAYLKDLQARLEKYGQEYWDDLDPSEYPFSDDSTASYSADIFYNPQDKHPYGIGFYFCDYNGPIGDDPYPEIFFDTLEDTVKYLDSNCTDKTIPSYDDCN